jgi:hypothetical protein
VDPEVKCASFEFTVVSSEQSTLRKQIIFDSGNLEAFSQPAACLIFL